LSNREKTGVQFQAGKTQNAGNQSSKVDWLNQVEGEWNRIMYERALDWKEFPVEVDDLLEDVSAQGVADKGKWISLFQFGDEYILLVVVSQFLKGGGGVFLYVGDEHRML
jgi:hypothetical protein